MTVLVAALTLAPTPTVLTPSPDLGAHAGTAMTNVAAFVHDIERQQIETAVFELGQQVASFVAASTPPLPRPALRTSPATASGTGNGGHSDAWWGGVAQCEQGGRNDPYYGFFSWMDGSQGGKPWAEQVAASNDLLARAGREIGPWAASCVAAGYRAAPW